jgi:hypothetical protein
VIKASFGTLILFLFLFAMGLDQSFGSLPVCPYWRHLLALPFPFLKSTRDPKHPSLDPCVPENQIPSFTLSDTCRFQRNREAKAGKNGYFRKINDEAKEMA